MIREKKGRMEQMEKGKCSKMQVQWAQIICKSILRRRKSSFYSLTLVEKHLVVLFYWQRSTSHRWPWNKSHKSGSSSFLSSKSTVGIFSSALTAFQKLKGKEHSRLPSIVTATFKVAIMCSFSSTWFYFLAPQSTFAPGITQKEKKKRTKL